MNDCPNLQFDLDHVTEWFRVLGFTLNLSKYILMNSLEIIR